VLDESGKGFQMRHWNEVSKKVHLNQQGKTDGQGFSLSQQERDFGVSGYSI
jgi:hypothetical protein